MSFWNRNSEDKPMSKRKALHSIAVHLARGNAINHALGQQLARIAAALEKANEQQAEATNTAREHMGAAGDASASMANAMLTPLLQALTEAKGKPADVAVVPALPDYADREDVPRLTSGGIRVAPGEVRTVEID